MEGIGWVDLSLLALLLVSVVIGLWRGLLFEVMSLAGWVAAYIAAQVFGPELAPHLPALEQAGAGGSGPRIAVAFVLVFVLALIVWSLLSALLRRLIQASPLSGLDRMLGGAFGLLRGVLVALVIVTVVQLTPFGKTPAWRASSGVVGLQTVLAGLRPWLPAELVRHLPA